MQSSRRLNQRYYLTYFTLNPSVIQTSALWRNRSKPMAWGCLVLSPISVFAPCTQRVRSTNPNITQNIKIKRTAVHSLCHYILNNIFVFFLSLLCITKAIHRECVHIQTPVSYSGHANCGFCQFRDISNIYWNLTLSLPAQTFIPWLLYNTQSNPEAKCLCWHMASYDFTRLPYLFSCFFHVNSSKKMPNSFKK